MNHLVWTVIIDRRHENLWRETLGQSDLDSWCAAHGWSSTDVVSNSVTVYAYRDGHTEVVADLFVRDPDGEVSFDPETQGARRRTVTVSLARSLPEGIGEVIR